MNPHTIEFYQMKADLCKTFADPKRLQLIDVLRGGEHSVGELVKSLAVPQAVVSRHLALLRGRGVVTTRRQGTRVYYALTDDAITPSNPPAEALLDAD